MVIEQTYISFMYRNVGYIANWDDFSEASLFFPAPPGSSLNIGWVKGLWQVVAQNKVWNPPNFIEQTASRAAALQTSLSS